MTRHNPGVILRGDRHECEYCKQLFNSSWSMVKHREGRQESHEERCMSQEQMEAAGFVKNMSGYWMAPSRKRWPFKKGTEAST